jgi:anthranilate synthase/aminodeoxychorismate synthase-like glutamine amidotransferase
MKQDYILVLDHKDSFTGNLVHLLHNFGEVEVIQTPAAEDCLSKYLKALILSPGPGHPKDYPGTLRLYHKAKEMGIPILGVCLGFQIILHAEGARIVRQPKVLHGVQTRISCDPKSAMYTSLPSQIAVGRYHSLQVEAESIPPHIRVTAWDESSKIPLSFELQGLSKISGVQYHPDSFLTEYGKEILRNTLDT